MRPVDRPGPRIIMAIARIRPRGVSGIARTVAGAGAITGIITGAGAITGIITVAGAITVAAVIRSGGQRCADNDPGRWPKPARSPTGITTATATAAPTGTTTPAPSRSGHARAPASVVADGRRRVDDDDGRRGRPLRRCRGRNCEDSSRKQRREDSGHIHDIELQSHPFPMITSGAPAPPHASSPSNKSLILVKDPAPSNSRQDRARSGHTRVAVACEQR